MVGSQITSCTGGMIVLRDFYVNKKAVLPLIERVAKCYGIIMSGGISSRLISFTIRDPPRHPPTAASSRPR